MLMSLRIIYVLLLFVSIAALITDLFMDRATFKGHHVKTKVPQLLELLDNCDIDSLLAFFEES